MGVGGRRAEGGTWIWIWTWVMCCHYTVAEDIVFFDRCGGLLKFIDFFIFFIVLFFVRAVFPIVWLSSTIYMWN